MGKRRIAIEKLDCPKARNVCFTKRRQGLFKKAAELSRLHNLQIASVVFSPAGTPFDFGNTSLLFDRYIAAACGGPSSSPSSVSDLWLDIHNTHISDKVLLNVDVSSLTVSELKDHASNLERLRARLLMSLDENKKDDSKEEDKTVGISESDGFGLTVNNNCIRNDSACDDLFADLSR